MPSCRSSMSCPALGGPSLGSLGSGQFEVRSRVAPIATAFHIEGHCLAVRNLVKASALHRRDVKEDVLRAAFGLDEAKTFSCVEPFHGAVGHREISSLVPPAEC